VFAQARRAGFSRAEADDVAQDVLVVLLTHRDPARTGAALRKWIYGVTRVTVHARRRRYAVRQRIEAALPEGALMGRVDPFGGCPESAFFARCACTIARRLPHTHCCAWHLHCVEERTHTEVAAALRCSVATTKRRVRAAARALAAA
jgi:DNA-directed RNA polymerase specialized sigma24 family protein